MGSFEAGAYRTYIHNLQMFSVFLFAAMVIGLERWAQQLAARKGSIINV